MARKNNRYKTAVCQFDFNLESNLFKIQQELTLGSFATKPYKHFVVTEPKTRQVSAPDFRDRVVQHSLVSLIEPILDKSFIIDAYACRKNKGTMFALQRVKKFLQASRSYYGSNTELYALKCDIKRFFPSISWNILLTILKRKIHCPETLNLIEKIITSHLIYGKDKHIDQSQLGLFENTKYLEEAVSIEKRKGLPIGNLTSQLFANVYLNELDQFVKNVLRQRWYGRYMDDFFIIGADKEYLKEVKYIIAQFLWDNLRLVLHPQKSSIQNVNDGVCFVGYRIFYDHILVRGSTLSRFRKKYKHNLKLLKKGIMTKEQLIQSQQSFMGHIKHANAWHLKKKLEEMFVV